ncbi:MAG: glycosyltransferase [Deltaproteobacteria bacterium]|nr:glycosyltransferase [Deltaproteobacteria bacterium]
MPLVSVVVPVWNGEQTIAQCLASLLKMHFPAERREILVVDNGSTDNTAAIVKRFPVRYLTEERRGAPLARNRGIRASQGEIVAFTDADCVVSRGWLQELFRAFDQGDVGGVAGEIFAYPPRTPAELYASRVRHLSPQKYLARPLLPFAVFANLAFRRSVFDQIGLLDEAMLTGEATDFCTRFFRATSLRLSYAPRAVVFHRHRSTTRGFLGQQWVYGRGHARLYIKYRQEIPWDWKHSFLAYRDLAKAAGALIRSAGLYGLGKESKQDFYFHYFEFLKKLAERLGFIRQSLAQGYLYF